MAYALRTILLGSLCIVATAQMAMSRHIQARPFAVDPTSNCASRCTIARGQISCPRFLVTPDNYPPGCYTGADQEGAAQVRTSQVGTDQFGAVEVDVYRSVTADDRQTPALIKNMPRASRSSQVLEMQRNADGSIDVYFGPRPLAGKDSNWVPTDPQRGFEMMFRVYGPKKEFFDKVRALPDVERIVTESTGAKQ